MSFSKKFYKSFVEFKKGKCINGINKFSKPVLKCLHNKLFPRWVFADPGIEQRHWQQDHFGFFFCYRIYPAFPVRHTTGEGHGTHFVFLQKIDQQFISLLVVTHLIHKGLHQHMAPL